MQKMNLVQVIGEQHLRILSLEENITRLQNEVSRLQEKIVQLTPSESEHRPTTEKPLGYIAGMGEGTGSK